MGKIRIEVKTSAMLGKLAGNWRKNLPRYAAVIRQDCNRYVRVDQGTLRASSYTASDLPRGRIVWHTPYARKVYYVGKPSKVPNANASLMWCEVAKKRHAKEWAKAIEEGTGTL